METLQVISSNYYAGKTLKLENIYNMDMERRGQYEGRFWINP